jgi:hypothetical protein
MSFNIVPSRKAFSTEKNEIMLKYVAGRVRDKISRGNKLHKKGIYEVEREIVLQNGDLLSKYPSIINSPLWQS